jgi:transposase
MQRQAYPSDLTDGQWEVVLSLMPAAKNGRTGRPRKYPLREIWNALMYIARTGCSWRQLPHDFPPWGDVKQHFRRWRNAGVIDQVHDALRDQARKNSKRKVQPAAGSIDSQSVRTAEKRGMPGATMRARRSPGASASSA